MQFILILLRFATKYPNITLEHYNLLFKKVQPEGKASVDRKKFFIVLQDIETF